MFDCSHCDYAFLDPLEAAGYRSNVVFDDAYFTCGGAGYTDYRAAEPLLRERGRRYGRLLRDTGARRVLDVGAAGGYVLAGMRDAGCEGVGLEPNQTMADLARRELSLDVRCTTLEAWQGDEQFDAVTLLQVMVHLEDVHGALAQLQRLVRPGGWCMVEFGDRSSLTARVLGTAWHEYAPPSVQRVFSTNALAALFSQYGFAHVNSGQPEKYLYAEHALSLLGYVMLPASVRAMLTPLRALVPRRLAIRYPGDDVRWMLFQRRLRPKDRS